jgi:hypothetical protein
VCGQHGSERLGIPDTARHREGSTDHRPAFAVRHARERLLREETLQPCPESAVSRRQQRERLAQKRDHLGVLLDQVRPVEAHRQQGFGHALAVPSGRGRGGEGPQEVVGALVPCQPEGAAAGELEVEALGLRRVRQHGVRAQGPSVLLRRDVEGQPRHRLLPGLARVAQGVRRVDERTGRGEVRRQFGGRDRSRGCRTLERGRESRVHAHPSAGRQVVDDGLAHEHVGEGEAIEGPGGAHEPCPLGGLQHVERAVELDACRGGDDVGVELGAGHGGDGQHGGRRIGEPRQPPPNHVAHAGRERSFSSVVAERADDLADEERVALGELAHAGGERRPAPGVGEQRGDVRFGERAELDAGDILAARQAADDVVEESGAAGLGVAVGGE